MICCGSRIVPCVAAGRTCSCTARFDYMQCGRSVIFDELLFGCCRCNASRLYAIELKAMSAVAMRVPFNLMRCAVRCDARRSIRCALQFNATAVLLLARRTRKTLSIDACLNNRYTQSMYELNVKTDATMMDSFLLSSRHTRTQERNSAAVAVAAAVTKQDVENIGDRRIASLVLALASRKKQHARSTKNNRTPHHRCGWLVSGTLADAFGLPDARCS